MTKNPASENNCQTYQLDWWLQIENVVKKFDFNELTIKNSKVERLVKASLEGKDTKVRALAKEIGAEYYGK